MPSVLHLISGDLWAGAEVMCLHLLTELRRISDMQVVAVVLNDGVLSRRLRAAGVDTRVVPEATCSFWSLARTIAQTARELGVSVLHSHRYREDCLAFVAGLRAGISVRVVTVHGLPEAWRRDGRLNAARAVKQVVYRAVLRHGVTSVVAVSQELRSRLITEWRLSGERIEAVHNGIPHRDPGTAVPSLSHRSSVGPRRIGTIARLVAIKGLDLFVRIAAELLATGSDVEFSILGDGPLRAALQRQVLRLGIANRVHLHPETEDVYRYLASLALYLNTSEHEGVPLSVLEAMAAGRVVVAPRVGGIPEVVSHGTSGWLVAERTPRAFAEAIAYLFAHPALRARLARNAASSVAECFTAERMAAAYADIYRRETCSGCGIPGACVAGGV